MSAAVRSLVPPDMDAKLDAEVLRLPLHMREGFLAYVRYGVPPGHFLLAILSNDLAEACARADLDNQRALYDYVHVLHNFAPADCWGGPAAIKDWIANGAALRRGQMAEASS